MNFPVGERITTGKLTEVKHIQITVFVDVHARGALHFFVFALVFKLSDEMAFHVHFDNTLATKVRDKNVIVVDDYRSWEDGGSLPEPPMVER